MGSAVNKLLKEIKKYVEPNAGLLIACSGGADSIALTDALSLLKDECGYKLAVMHVEHGLRGEEALHDAAFVESFCQARGLTFVCRHIKAGEYAAKHGLSIEDAARRLRYRELWKYFDELKADYLLTAHHADDQAETVLMQLLRGSGTAGIGGMRIKGGRLLRPFLFVQRCEIEAYCAERNLNFCTDSSNSDVHYTRNRIRMELLPYLKTHFNPQLTTALGHTARLAKADSDFAFWHAEKFYREHVQNNGVLQCNANALNNAFAAVSTRVIRMMWEQKAVPGSELGFEHVGDVLQLLHKGISGKMIMLPGSAAAAYAYGNFYIGTQSEIKSMLSAADDKQTEDEIIIHTNSISPFAEFCLPDGSTLHISITDNLPKITNSQAAVPLELAGKIITIRRRRNGDRFYPYGGVGAKKLKDYFIDKKIPLAERDSKLLVAAGNNILWIIGMRQAGWKTKPEGKWLVMRFARRKDE
mgnify:CR=1 FL=1